ncbi:hypothetical protein V565_094740, partial [Rhizoctonia solani 123E]
MSRAQSPEGSATSQAAADTDWMQYVGWDGGFHPLDDVAYDQRPEVKKLRKILEKSFIVPAWLANIESPEWATYKRTQRLRDSASNLSSKMSLPKYISNNDEGLSFDVQESLAFILHIPRHAIALQSHFSPLEPMEADRRHPVDTLGSLVWDFQSAEHVIYRTERKLAIPCLPKQANQTRQARRENTGEVQPDACAFIPLGINFVLSGVLENARAALSCFPSTDSLTSHHIYILHWVTEYKRDQDQLNSKRQVAEGLVSALYQRRAYGFPDHFVFGTAHYSRTVIEVVAATWVCSDETDEPVARPQEAKTASVMPLDDQNTSPPRNSFQVGDTTSSPPKAGEEALRASTSLTTEDIKKYNKIVMYSLARYNMTRAEDMMRLYLLMRYTRTLARQYAGEIEKDDYAQVHELLKKAKEFYQWSPTPRAQSNRSEPNSFASVSERQSEGMSIDSYEDSDCNSDPEELKPPNDGSPTQRIAGE